MNTIGLKAQTRTTKGNSPARALRRKERVPAILYGPGSSPRMLSIDAHEFDVIVKKGSLGRSVLNLFVDDNQTPTSVMIKEFQTHPVTNSFLHVDFYEVAMDRKIWVNVPVTTTGKALGLDKGGMLQLVRRELEVYCFPNAIPATITIDVSNLDIGDSVHVEDIQIEGDAEIPHDVNFTVLNISAMKQEAEAVSKEGEAAEGEAAKASVEE